MSNTSGTMDEEDEEAIELIDQVIDALADVMQVGLRMKKRGKSGFRMQMALGSRMAMLATIVTDGVLGLDELGLQTVMDALKNGKFVVGE